MYISRLVKQSFAITLLWEYKITFRTFYMCIRNHLWDKLGAYIWLVFHVSGAAVAAIGHAQHSNAAAAIVTRHVYGAVWPRAGL